LSLVGSSLRDAVADKAELRFTENDGEGGAQVRAGLWTVPPVISGDDLRDARLYVQAYEYDAVPAGPERVEDWLIALFNGKAHNMTPTSLAARAAAIAEGLEDFPRHCFTRESRKRARRLSDFIPTDKELIDFCELVDREEREVARRMMAILDAGARSAAPPRTAPGESPRQSAQWGWSSEAERMDHERYLREKRDRERSELAAIARAKAAEAGEELPPPPAPRLAHETDREFVTRMNEPLRKFLDAETEHMRRGGKGRGGRTRIAAGSPVQVAEALKVLKGTPPVPRPDIAERARVQEAEPEPEPSPEGSA
jgi:hypothetical protein